MTLEEKTVKDSPRESERKEALREAATRLFAEKGYAATSMQMLMDACGVNKALVYYYFGSKEKLFRRILEEYFDGLATIFSDALSGDGDLRARLERAVERYIDYLAANPHAARLVQREVATQGPGLEISRERLWPFFGAATELLGSSPAARGVAAGDIVQMLISVHGMVISYFTYAPLLTDLMGADALGRGALEARKRHVVAMVRMLLDQALGKAKGAAR